MQTNAARCHAISRRGALTLGVCATLTSLIRPLQALSTFALRRRASSSGGDLEDGTYRNPVIGGNHPDAGAIRVGNDFYITHSSFSYTPGLVIMTSRDLVNWRIAGSALKEFYGEIWAPYLCEYRGHYYIYYPRNGHLEVVHAPSPLGPWSQPIPLKINGIDPAHIATPDGRRFLYFAGGLLAQLSVDGLSVLGAPRKVFSAWPIPTDWRIECECLEAPKVIFRNGYYYLNVAQGGTAGPATSHMMISARSRNVDGPWEYSPFNPILHTKSKKEQWWSTGHGRLIDDAKGGWWVTFHGYENGFRTLGRSTLLLPVEWTTDQWFRIPEGVTAGENLPMPPGKGDRISLPEGDDFKSPTLALNWQFWKGYDPDRYKSGDGQLVLKAQGSSLSDSPVMTVCATDHSYLVEVDVELVGNCEAGLLLFYNENHSVGLRLGPQGLGAQRAGDLQKGVQRATLRVVNVEQEVDFYYKPEGGSWTKVTRSVDVSCYEHNILGGFHDLRPALFALGEGHAVFRSFRLLPVTASA